MRMGKFSFGLASIGFQRAGVLVAEADITGSVTIPHGHELISSMGGAAQYPVAARAARASGEFTIVLNERPYWVDEVCSDATRLTTAAAGAAVITSTGPLATSIVIAITATSRFAGLISIDATSASQVTVRGVTSDGATTEEAVTLNGVAATTVASAGISIAKVSAAALTVGETATVEVVPAHGGAFELQIPQIRTSTEYAIVAFSARGGVSDSIWRYDLPRTVIAGASSKLEDNVGNAEGVEISGLILAPADSSAPIVRTLIEPA